MYGRTWGDSAWTPKVSKRITIESILGGFWAVFYILLGSR